MIDGADSDDALSQPDRRPSRISRKIPLMIDSSKWEVIEAGLQMRAGQERS